MVCLQIRNFSQARVQLDISLVRWAHWWDVELKTRRDISYPRMPVYHSLFQQRCYHVINIPLRGWHGLVKRFHLYLFKCGSNIIRTNVHFLTRLTTQGMHSSQQVLGHLLWIHRLSHFSGHGGQFFVHGSLQRWRHTRRLSQSFLHGTCILPCLQSLQFPTQGWPQSRIAWHGSSQRQPISDSSKHGFVVSWPQSNFSITITWQVKEAQTSQHFPGQKCPQGMNSWHFSWHLYISAGVPQDTRCKWPQEGMIFSTSTGHPAQSSPKWHFLSHLLLCSRHRFVGHFFLHV